MRAVRAKIDPKLVNDDLMKHCMQIRYDINELVKIEPDLLRAVFTGHFECDPETKLKRNQWKKAIESKLKVKVMLIVFFVHNEFF